MFAVIKTGGKQYKVQKDDKLKVERLDAEEGGSINLAKVWFVGDGQSSKIGDPIVKGAQVKAKVLEHIRAPKVTIFKKKRRQNYRRTKGHRQDQTVLQITDIKAA